MSAGQERIAAELGRLGLPHDSAWSLSGLVDRVEDAVGGPEAGVESVAAPAALSSQGPLDVSGWVWRNPVSEVTAEREREQEGPLKGWRLAVKDLIAVAGRPIGAGSRACFDATFETLDAPVVRALRAAGAALTGTTKLHEFAFGTTGINATDGTPDNPKAPGCIPGGSSSGSAVVVASGEADLALGTDTGGSVRIPAALCGTVGFKPSFGSLSTVGVFALSPSLDHLGLLVADAETLVAPASVLGLVIGEDVPRQLRLGLAKGALDLASPSVRAAVESAIEKLRRSGVTVSEADWPLGELVFAATTAIMYAEAAHGHRARLVARAALYGDDVRNRLVQGAGIDQASYLQSRLVGERLRLQCLASLDGLDAVLTPTVPIEAPMASDVLADPSLGASLVTYTRLANLTGLPAISLPLPGGTAPIGLQIEAAHNGAALRSARAIARLLVV